MKTIDKVEREVLELWKEMSPSRAFAAGLDDCAGMVFIPTEERTRTFLAKVRATRERATRETERRILDYMETSLIFREPYMVPSEVLWAFFRHLVREGINEDHLVSVAHSAREALAAARENLKEREWPLEVLVHTSNYCKGLRTILSEVEKESGHGSVDAAGDELLEEVERYQNEFGVEGIVEGDFSEVYPLLEERGGDVGRRKIYPQILRRMHDIVETPEEIERKASNWLRKELPFFLDIARELSEIYGCERRAEDIEEEILKRRKVVGSNLLEFVEEFRRSARGAIEEHLVRITPNYETRVVETPPYLVSFFPTAAMTTFGYLTDKPFNIIFVTTDEKRSPPIGSPMLFQTMVHEEYGHCVNYSNSNTSFWANPTLSETLSTTLARPITDGIAFHREMESYEMLRSISSKKDLTQSEKDLMKFLSQFDDLDTWLLETHFEVMMWRIIRFLRAIGDVRVNMGSQSLADFVEWGHSYTGLGRKTIFDQIFIFQAEVGYAPCYSLGADLLRSLQEDARKSGKSLLDFNTYASSLGFGGLTVFARKLRAWITS